MYRHVIWTTALGLIACNGDPASPPEPVLTDDTSTVPTEPSPPPTRAVVLMIGDGMGMAHVEAGAWYVHGAATGLTVQGLPVQGFLRTANLDGIGDSASCGTVMAAGPHTWNGAIAVDRHAAPVESVLEAAASRDWGTGVVTTTELSHATPAVFTAHHPDRDDQAEIAALQLESPVDVLLGGGWSFIYGQDHEDSKRTDDGLLDDMTSRGITWVDSASALETATSLPVHGAFFRSHLPYVANRDGTEDIPSLATMTQFALERLEDNPNGLFLVVEGGRIDHASHGNKIELLVDEVSTFDASIATVLDWAATTEHELTLIVTADHECGGLEILSGGAAGELPEVSWRWGHHTNTDVPVFASGPGTEVLDGQLLDQAWIHSVLHNRVTGADLVSPPTTLLPDGRFDDLTHRSSEQTVTSSEGDTLARLEALEVGSDEDGLSIGIEGLFPFQTHSISLLIDVDFGAETGPSQILGYANDIDHPVDLLISSLPLLDPGIPGLGIDLVAVSEGGVETPYLFPFRGLRGLHGAWGSPTDLGSLKVGLNYGAEVRTAAGAPLAIVPGEGFEAYIPWNTIWPDLQGQVPPGTTIAVYAILTNLEGTELTNQSLPPMPAGTPAPRAVPAAPAGVLVIPIDPDFDGVATQIDTPYTLP